MAAWVKGGASDTEAAIEAAAALLAGARAPVVAGLCAELSAVRAACRLAAVAGASLDSVAGPELYADLGALGVGGAMATTTTETLGRADVVLVLGTRPWAGGLADEIAASAPTRGRTAGAGRAVLALGGPPDGTARRKASHVAYATGNLPLPVAIVHLRAFAKGHLAGDEPLHELARRLFAARFGVAVYDPGELGEHGVEMLQGLVRELNDTTRFFAVPLSDPFEGRAVLQLSSWLTGQAPRVGFGRGAPEHDPWRFDAARQIEAGEADAALWLASLPAPRPSWLARVPTVALVGADEAQALSGSAEVVIAVGVPGRTVGGAVWNARRGAIGYVPPAEAGDGAPEAAGILDRIRARLGGSGHADLWDTRQTKGATC